VSPELTISRPQQTERWTKGHDKKTKLNFKAEDESIYFLKPHLHEIPVLHNYSLVLMLTTELLLPE
jgi:hypothetical protein